MSNDELLKRLCSNSILGQMPHPSFDRKPFDVAMHITEEERQELIAQRSEAETRIREQRELLDECERALTYYAATVSESRRCYAVNLLAKLRSQEKADE